MSIWSDTYRCAYLHQANEPSIITAIHGDSAPYKLVSEIKLSAAAGGRSNAQITTELSPREMRELARMLMRAADRVEYELQPLLDKLNAPPVSGFGLSASLYREPEAA